VHAGVINEHSMSESNNDSRGAQDEEDDDFFVWAPRHGEESNWGTSVDVKSMNMMFSMSLFKGNVRESQEDRGLAAHLYCRGADFFVFAVMDGHGGHEAAELVSRRLVPSLKRRLEGGYPPRKALCTVFEDLDSEVSETGTESGTTLTVLMHIRPNAADTEAHKHYPPIPGPEWWIANVGDSSAYGFMPSGKVRSLTVDHKPTLASEAKRIIDMGLRIDEQQHYVVNPATNDGLAMTRSIGDAAFGSAVTPTPRVTHLSKVPSCIVLASDGLWDIKNAAMLGRDAMHPAAFLFRVSAECTDKDRSSAAERIMDWRSSEFSQHDNTTVMVVYT